MGTTIFTKNITLPLRWIVMIIYIVLTISLGILYFYNNSISQKIEPLLGGALVSIIAIIAQFLVSFNDYKNNEKLQKFRVIDFLERRDDKNYYRKLIKNTNKNLNLLFYTGKRFSDDFCQNAANDNELILCLERGVQVRLLLSSRDYLHDQKHQRDHDSAIDVYHSLSKQYKNFLFQTYDHMHCHNIFSSELDTIVGPYFHNKQSKYSHSIHFHTNAPYVSDYLDYFENEWKTNGQI